MSNNLKDDDQFIQPSQNSMNDSEIDFRAILSVIWCAKWWVVVITIVFTFLAAVYAINQPNIYKAEALLAPAESEGNTGLGGLAGQFGGLASLAGVNLSGQGVNKTHLALEVMRSRKFTSEFIQKHDLLPELLAAKKWNSGSDSIIYHEGLYNPVTKQWVREVTLPRVSKPSMQEAYKAFRKILTINTDKDTGMVTISIEHISPSIAKRWVDWLVEDINQSMKERDVLEAHQSTDFLTKQLESTNVADIRSVLYNLIEEQAKTIMFANVRDEYVFKTIDPALVPESKDRPHRGLIIMLGFIFGLTLSLTSIFIRSYF
ncbi:Wzz/FepE/Etk N-terminal domain-containing protein [Pseudoalteromonas marina]|uniref:Wzz/FepE/Etk N-terminal domain-containing protein n=1 Tax=Pseudoalteromonas marina TaxID=267375 RepID=UPI0023F3E143|nr:Wzz/FepE/Etk N-terminal domain-containing protein [Pseudoalteromonas marina]